MLKKPSAFQFTFVVAAFLCLTGLAQQAHGTSLVSDFLDGNFALPGDAGENSLISGFSELVDTVTLRRTVTVPEPSLVLLLLGGLAVAGWRRRESPDDEQAPES